VILEFLSVASLDSFVRTNRVSEIFRSAVRIVPGVLSFFSGCVHVRHPAQVLRREYAVQRVHVLAQGFHSAVVL
jgi:hypothetical protein